MQVGQPLALVAVPFGHWRAGQFTGGQAGVGVGTGAPGGVGTGGGGQIVLGGETGGGLAQAQLHETPAGHAGQLHTGGGSLIECTHCPPQAVTFDGHGSATYWQLFAVSASQLA